MYFVRAILWPTTILYNFNFSTSFPYYTGKGEEFHLIIFYFISAESVYKVAVVGVSKDLNSISKR